MTTPYFGFSEAEDSLGFGDIDDESVGGIFNTIQPLVDHVAVGLGKLPSQFFDSENLKHLLTVYLEEIQKVEETLYQINKQQSIEFASGAQLDGIGEDVGILRNGITNDDTYRRYIRAKVLINKSEGTPSDILDAWATLLNNDNVELTEEFPAGILLYSPKAIDDNNVLNLISQTVALTVKVSVLSAKDEGVDPFCFLGGTGAGFGTADDPNIGGQFVGRYDI